MTIKDSVFVYHLQDPKEVQWHGRHHYHGEDEYEIHYFLEGEGCFLNGPAKYILQPGMVFISPPSVRHKIEARDIDHPISYYAVLLKIDSEDREVRGLFQNHLAWERSYMIGERYRFFFEELRERALAEKSYLRKSAVHQVISFLYLLAEEETSLQYGAEENLHIERALMVMQKNVFRKITLGTIAGKLQISEEHLIRLFKKKLSTTPMRYYTRLRIEAATSMLISSNLLIYQIAEKLQFHSEFHFSKVFKQYTGLSPKFYRNRYRQLIGESPDHESIIYLG